MRHEVKRNHGGGVRFVATGDLESDFHQDDKVILNVADRRIPMNVTGTQKVRSVPPGERIIPGYLVLQPLTDEDAEALNGLLEVDMPVTVENDDVKSKFRVIEWNTVAITLKVESPGSNIDANALCVLSERIEAMNASIPSRLPLKLKPNDQVTVVTAKKEQAAFAVSFVINDLVVLGPKGKKSSGTFLGLLKILMRMFL